MVSSPGLLLPLRPPREERAGERRFDGRYPESKIGNPKSKEGLCATDGTDSTDEEN